MRVLAQGFFAAVAGDPGKGLVYVDDLAVGGRDQDTLAGVGEHAGREMQLLVGLLAVGDVAHDADEIAQAPVVVVHR